MVGNVGRVDTWCVGLTVGLSVGSPVGMDVVDEGPVEGPATGGSDSDTGVRDVESEGCPVGGTGGTGKNQGDFDAGMITGNGGYDEVGSIEGSSVGILTGGVEKFGT